MYCHFLGLGYRGTRYSPFLFQSPSPIPVPVAWQFFSKCQNIQNWKRVKLELNKNFLYHLNKTVNKRAILFPFFFQTMYFILYVKCKMYSAFQEFNFENHKGSNKNNCSNNFLIFLGKYNQKMIECFFSYRKSFLYGQGSLQKKITFFPLA